MGLLTSPQVVNDGVADRTFEFLHQSTLNGGVGGLYSEVSAAIAAESKILSKHSETKNTIRTALQSMENEFDVNGVSLGRVTANVTLTYSKNNTAAFIKKRALIAVNAAKLAGVLDGLLAKKI